MSDDGQHGLTLIALIGSVFSPYYAWSRQRGQADPLDHCAINVALYGRNGKRWAMTERGRTSLHRTGDSLTIGPSALAWDGDALVIDVDEIAAPIPARIRGRIKVHPEAINTQDFALDADGRHRWWPVGPVSRVEVELKHPNLRWSGPGYLDSNRGSEPLEDAFQGWDWSRAELKQGAAILYDVRTREGRGPGAELALRCDHRGQLDRFDPPPRVPLQTTRVWRIGRGTQSEPGHETRVVDTLEDTPFYARSVIESQLLGEHATSVHESLCLDRFSSTWVRTLLPFRMPRIAR
ncbi:hydroxyneurosporene synthase [Thiorhodococcus drewsii AZ1]|uniref:Hydroxyneurosporene synthase n=1 Tax=Thiorhodococcus drewsii AZ1 TaxID=765913 RepID=G2DXP4_9GAMM|nr:hydroxyneurosporene synthase [Thiorhodococcus drewsii AZ1]